MSHAILVVSLLALSQADAARLPSRDSVRSLGLAAEHFSLVRPLVAAVVSEARMGSADLNGDGDALDGVVHVFDVERNELVGLGLAATRVRTDGCLVAFAVEESAQGTDLDGDGDLTDGVLHVYDRRTGETVNTGFALSAGASLGFDQSRVYFVVSERDQEGTDLNGDGDVLDHVLHVLDLATGASTNSGLAVLIDPFLLDTPLPLVGSLAVVRVHEAAQASTDLNGDGDLDDTVVHLFDGETGDVRGLGLADVFGPAVQGGLVTLRASEAGQAEDLNGDGDLEDIVLFLFDPSSDELVNTGYAGWLLEVGPGGRLLALTVSESMQGETDLNGDGDALDFVPQLLDRENETAATLGLAALNPRFLERPGTRGGDSIVLLVDVIEELQGSEDLNGDGDARDGVLHAIDLATGGTVSTGIATRDSSGGFLGDPVASPLLAIRASEPDAGGRDFNGDGDASDVVVQVVDVRSRRIANTALASFCCDANLLGAFTDVYENWVLFPVRESSQGASDLNGDGDAFDDVLFAFDARSRRAFDLGIAVDTWSRGRDGGLFLFQVREGAQGADLNGDGDTNDTVLHLLDLER